MTLTIDHFVLACADLADAERQVAAALGGPAVGHGRHDFMGTHNALWRVGSAYLELIAIDPEGANPDQPRWFGLDSVNAPQTLQQTRFIAWMAASDMLETDLAKSPWPFETPMACSRDHLSWRVCLPQGRAPLGGGAYPHMIQWDPGVTPPGQSLTDTGLGLSRFAVHAPSDTLAALTTLGAAGLVDTLREAPQTRMELTLTRPDGGTARFSSEGGLDQ
ncbi:MAG: VOC family protein [Pseudomonadota bacterium]